MECAELLKVEATFEIGNDDVKMLILHPNLSVPNQGWKERTENVIVATPEGKMLEATAKISLSHINIPDPQVSIEQRWRITVLLLNRSKEEVPVGSTIMVSPEVREALAGRES